MTIKSQDMENITISISDTIHRHVNALTTKYEPKVLYFILSQLPKDYEAWSWNFAGVYLADKVNDADSSEERELVAVKQIRPMKGSLCRGRA